jgi:predicted transcriptional regulator
MFSKRISSCVPAVRQFSVLYSKKMTAMDLFKNSCYNKVDFKINENAHVNEAVARYKLLNIGCLVVTNDEDKVVGVCSGRDYLHKVAYNNKNSHEVKVRDICTYEPNIIVARSDESIDSCMNKMLFKNIRHMLITDDKTNECVGLISIKDVVKEIMKDNRETITRLSDFNLGKGAFFGSE